MRVQRIYRPRGGRPINGWKKRDSAAETMKSRASQVLIVSRGAGLNPEVSPTVPWEKAICKLLHRTAEGFAELAGGLDGKEEEPTVS